MGPTNRLRQIFLCGHRKSGTTLFQNIFDGHTQILVYPIDLNVLYAYYPKFNTDQFSDDYKKERLSTVIFEELNSRTQIKQIHLERVKNVFFKKLNGNYNDIDLIILSLKYAWESVFREPSHEWFLFKETSIEIYHHDLDKLFPDSIFFCLIRDPRDNFAALKAGVDKYYSKIGEDNLMTLFSLILRLQTSLRYLKDIGPSYSNLNLISFEELTTQPGKQIQHITEILDIQFEKSLLIPTVTGNKTEGNSFEGKKFNKISSANVGSWTKRLSDFEIQIIEYYLKDLMQHFGYEPSLKEFNPSMISEWYKWMNYKYLFHDRFTI